MDYPPLGSPFGTRGLASLSIPMRTLSARCIHLWVRGKLKVRYAWLLADEHRLTGTLTTLEYSPDERAPVNTR